MRSRIERPGYPLVPYARYVVFYVVAFLSASVAFGHPILGVIPAMAAASGLRLTPENREGAVRRALARHGLTPSRPVPAPWQPAGPLGAPIVVSLVVTLGIGLSVVGYHEQDRLRCPGVPTSTAERIHSLVADDTASLPPWKGATLHTFRQVSTGEGQHVVAALVQVQGQRFGPAVWHTVEPHTRANPGDELQVQAVPGLATELTPSLGTFSEAPYPYSAIRATNCVV